MAVLILRDPRESWKKCSLRTLRGVDGVEFVTYRPGKRVAVGERILLHAEGEELTEADQGLDLMLVDCSWRRVPTLLGTVDGTLHRRRLPRLSTAYPRVSRFETDPDTGLASLEALYAASFLLGEPRPEWLAGYRWAEEFLDANPQLRAPSG